MNNFVQELDSQVDMLDMDKTQKRSVLSLIPIRELICEYFFEDKNFNDFLRSSVVQMMTIHKAESENLFILWS